MENQDIVGAKLISTVTLKNAHKIRSYLIHNFVHVIYLNLYCSIPGTTTFAESWGGSSPPSSPGAKPLFVQGVGAALERHDLGIAAQQIFQFGAPFGVAEKEVLLKNHNVLPAGPAEDIGDTVVILGFRCQLVVKTMSADGQRSMDFGGGILPLW